MASISLLPPKKVIKIASLKGFLDYVAFTPTYPERELILQCGTESAKSKEN